MGTQILQVLEKTKSFDSMLGHVRATICQWEPSLEFYTTQIQPIIHHRWDHMNTPLHMATYALNPKWHVESPRRDPPVDNPKVKNGFQDATGKMYFEEDGSKL